MYYFEETEWVELLESGCNKLHHIGKTNLNLLLTEMLSINFDFLDRIWQRKCCGKNSAAIGPIVIRIAL